MEYSSKINDLKEIIENFRRYQRKALPLCAAENPLSEFCKLPLSGDFQERYIMGNYDNYNPTDNFIGSSYLEPFYEMLQQECKQLFGSLYSDARTLSGMNCITAILMALTESNEKIAILQSEWGGHPSVNPICHRLGLDIYDLPYDIDNYDLDYDRVNRIIAQEGIDYILLAPSDIIYPPHIENLNLSKTILIYDISQIMGLIAAGKIENPLKFSDNIILIGGTHKTLPGPTSGLILTNNSNLHTKINTRINPIFLRNTKMHQIVSLLFTLLEFEFFGKSYMDHLLKCTKILSQKLEYINLPVAKRRGQYSNTHQIFLNTTYDGMNTIWNNAINCCVSLNKKEKSLFNGHGIRIGTQEIARYGWEEDELSIISRIISQLTRKEINYGYINELLSLLPPKQIKYTFPDCVIKHIRQTLS